MTHDQMGDLDQARADLDRAIALQIDEPTAYRARGRIHEQQGRTQEALADYETALRLEPDDAHTYYLRGNVRKELGDLDGAESDANEAIRLEPEEMLHHHLRGWVRLNRGDRDGAIEDMETVCRLEPDNEKAHGVLGWIYLRRGQARFLRGELEQVLADLNRAQELRPDDVEVLLSRASQQMIQGEAEAARADFEAVLVLQPGHTRALLGRAWVRLSCLTAMRPVPGQTVRKPWPMCQMTCRASGSRGWCSCSWACASRPGDLQRRPGCVPHLPMGYLGRWAVHFEEDQFDEALEDCEALLRLDSNHALAYLLRSRVGDSQGDTVEALYDRERATQMNPDLADILLGDLQADRVTKISPKLIRAFLKESLHPAEPPQPFPSGD